MAVQKHERSKHDLDRLLSEFERKIGALHQSYARYFHGVDRRPPSAERRALARMLHELEHRTRMPTTQHRFRLNTLSGRFATYRTLWDRTMRQIEEGTYVRDRQRAKARTERALARRPAEAPELSLDLDLDAVGDLGALADELFSDLQAQASRAAPAPPPESEEREELAPPPGAARSRAAKLDVLRGKLGARDPGHEERRAARLERLRARVGDRAQGASAEADRVYRNLLEAKRRCNEPTESLSLEHVRRSMARERERLRREGKAAVDFKVVIKGGRAFMKPHAHE